MRFFRKSKFLAVATLTVFYVASCSTKSEDDASLEEKEPVEASAEKAPADATGKSSGEAATAPEAKPADSIAVPTSPGAASESTGSMESSARRVMYIKSNGVAMREKAEPKAKVVGKLNKGDHILVTIEGEWARTDDGKYINMKSLSEKGIGRAKRDAAWSGGGSSAESVAAKSAEAGAEPAKKLPKKTTSGAKKAPASKGAEAAPADQAPSTAAPADEQP